MTTAKPSASVPTPSVDYDEDEQECGYVYDHDIETTYEGDDGWSGVCRNCGAELWEDPEPSSLPPVRSEKDS